MLDVVRSNEWANLKLEEGDGGNVNGGRITITNGKISKFVEIDSLIPDGWWRGRPSWVNAKVSRSVKKRYNETNFKPRGSIGRRWFKRGNEMLLVKRGEEPEGFIPGRVFTKPFNKIHPSPNHKKAIHTPYGTFGSIKEFSEKFELSYYKINKLLKEDSKYYLVSNG